MRKRCARCALRYRSPVPLGWASGPTPGLNLGVLSLQCWGCKLWLPWPELETREARGQVSPRLGSQKANRHLPPPPARRTGRSGQPSAGRGPLPGPGTPTRPREGIWWQRCLPVRQHFTKQLSSPSQLGKFQGRGNVPRAGLGAGVGAGRRSRRTAGHCGESFNRDGQVGGPQPVWRGWGGGTHRKWL